MEIRGALLPCCIATLSLLSGLCNVAFAAKVTIANGCSYTVWPGILPNAGSSLLASGGFELAPGQYATIQVSPGWSGRLWGRTGCKFSTSGTGTCASGDCGGKLQCEGAGATTPATLAEFTFAGLQPNVKQDFYDVSLVDGYNIPIAVVPTSGTGTCGTAGCARDLNVNCPAELQLVAEDVSSGGSSAVVGCKSACDAFGDPSQKSVTGLQQPRSDLMGAQAYASATSRGQAGPRPTACIMLLTAIVISVVAPLVRFPCVRLFAST